MPSLVKDNYSDRKDGSDLAVEIVYLPRDPSCSVEIKDWTTRFWKWSTIARLRHGYDEDKTRMLFICLAGYYVMYLKGR